MSRWGPRGSEGGTRALLAPDPGHEAAVVVRLCGSCWSRMSHLQCRQRAASLGRQGRQTSRRLRAREVPRLFVCSASSSEETHGLSADVQPREDCQLRAVSTISGVFPPSASLPRGIAARRGRGARFSCVLAAAALPAPVLGKETQTAPQLAAKPGVLLR